MGDKEEVKGWLSKFFKDFASVRTTTKKPTTTITTTTSSGDHKQKRRGSFGRMFSLAKTTTTTATRRKPLLYLMIDPNAGRSLSDLIGGLQKNGADIKLIDVTAY